MALGLVVMSGAIFVYTWLARSADKAQTARFDAETRVVLSRPATAPPADGTQTLSPGSFLAQFKPLQAPLLACLTGAVGTGPVLEGKGQVELRFDASGLTGAAVKGWSGLPETVPACWTEVLWATTWPASAEVRDVSHPLQLDPGVRYPATP